MPVVKLRASSFARERSEYWLSAEVACALAPPIPVGAELVEPKVESGGGYCDMSKSESDCRLIACGELQWVLGIPFPLHLFL